MLLTSAAEIGFAWDGDAQGWIRAALPSLRMLAGPLQHLQSAIFEACQLKISAQLADRKGFGEQRSFGIFADLHNYLPLPTLRERDKMLLRSILCGEGGKERMVSVGKSQG